MPLPSDVEIAPAEGKLGVLLPGMGAVGTTFISGVLAIRKGLAKPIGSLTQMGTIRLGRPHRRQRPADQGLRAARRPRRPRLRRLGRLPRRRLRRRQAGRRARAPPASSSSATSCGPSSRCRRCSSRSTSATCTATTSSPAATKMEWAEALIDDIQTFSESQRLRPARRRVVRLDGDLQGAHRRPPDPRGLRAGPARQPPRHRPEPDLRLRLPEARHPDGQRRAQPQLRLPGADGPGPRRTRCPSPARTSRPARR